MQISKTLSLEEEVVVRTVSQTDLPALEWGGEYSHYRLLYQDAYQGVLRGEAIMWVAELESAGIVGQLFVQLLAKRGELADGYKRAYLYGFRVKPIYRKQGIGSRMLNIVEADLSKRGFHWISLNVGKDNSLARRLYEKHGYRVVTSEQGRWTYIDDRGRRRQVNEPAWRMEKEIVDSKKVSVLLN
jgi:ribosomal protein S18 acetylase RimI-like enzyme